jgi:hypothetical protein
VLRGGGCRHPGRGCCTPVLLLLLLLLLLQWGGNVAGGLQ